jgi:hypothetical protein
MRVSQQIAAAIVASFFVFGVIETFAENLNVVHLFLLAVLGFAWCEADVRDRVLACR